ncbi:hypothetical protein BLOT_011331 [Blomia tropicalis]|nr:hypothetical protein BLOT_011331 [Blomia tropicalis]
MANESASKATTNISYNGMALVSMMITTNTSGTCARWYKTHRGGTKRNQLKERTILNYGGLKFDIDDGIYKSEDQDKLRRLYYCWYSRSQHYAKRQQIVCI